MNFYGNRILHEERIHNLEQEQRENKPHRMNRFNSVRNVIGDIFIHIGTTLQK